MGNVFYGRRTNSELGDFFEKINAFSQKLPYVIRMKNFASDDIVPKHCAENIEILFYHNVSGFIRIDNQQFTLEGRQVFVVPPNIIHETTAYRCDGFQLVMQLSLDDLKPYLDLEKAMDSLGICVGDLSFYCPEADAIWGIFQNLIEYDGQLLLCISEIARLFAILVRYADPDRGESGESQQPQRDKGSSPENLRRILQWTRENYHNKITVDSAAAIIGYSKHYFCYWFKRNTGITYMSYLSNIRYSNACLLLKSGKSVTESCFACGFSDLPYFVQQFKKRYSLTPYQYALLYCAQEPVRERPVKAEPKRRKQHDPDTEQ